jgi:hypothetical protein
MWWKERMPTGHQHDPDFEGTASTQRSKLVVTVQTLKGQETELVGRAWYFLGG